jgi:hypothetical protein
MRREEREMKRKILRERQSDEDFLYYVLERDLDREAVFLGHDGWINQVSWGRRKRIDYIVRYGNGLYGIEVKKGSPHHAHFEQAVKYSDALDGVFLAYPSERVGQALYVSEKKQEYANVGLISLTLFRSHIIKKVKPHARLSEEIWNNYADDEGYLKELKSRDWERVDGLPATLLRDGCFWISFGPKGKEKKRNYKLPFSRSDWVGLGLLYGATLATSLDRYFSRAQLRRKRRDLGWKSYEVWGLVQSDLAWTRTYGERQEMYSLSPHAYFLESQIRKALKRELGTREWNSLVARIAEWKRNHMIEQKKHENTFVQI